MNNATFGQGWMSGNARDLVRICVTFGGYDGPELIRRIAISTAGNAGETINVASVERVLQEMTDEWDAAHAQPT